MGEIQLITTEQKIILDELRQNDFLQSHFYFTGGTALSSIYLQHRYSEDLDFFSEEKFDNKVLFAQIEEFAKKHNFTFSERFVEVVYIFNLKFKNGTNLKVDFGYYPYPRIKKGECLDNIYTDSLTDIAVNKLLTISQRTDVKDFVDLFYLLQNFTVWDLMEGLRMKFRVKTEPLLLASDFLKVEDFNVLPRMIKPLSLDELKLFFREKAKDLGRKAIE